MIGLAAAAAASGVPTILTIPRLREEMERVLEEPVRRDTVPMDGGENAEVLPIIARIIKHLRSVVRILFLKVWMLPSCKQQSLG